MENVKPPANIIDVVLDRQTAKDVLRGLLHAILFHRLLGTVKPQTLEVLDITLPAVKDPDTEALVEEKVNTYWRAVENERSKRGQIVLTFSEKRQKKWTVTQIFSPGEVRIPLTHDALTGWLLKEEVPWEEWIINAELRQPRTDRDRQALTSNLTTTISDALRRILTHTSSERGRAAVPLITNPFNGLSPFPISIRVKVGGVEVAS